MKPCHALAALILASAVVALAVPAGAQTTYAYDQQDTATPTGSISMQGSGASGQTFVPTASLMDTVTFVINVADNQGGKSGEVAQLSVQFIAGAGLGGHVLATSNTLTLPPTDPGQVTRTFRFPATVALTPGNTYTLVVVFSGTTAPDVSVLIFGTTAESYASGVAYPTGGGIADYDFQEGFGTPSLTTLQAIGATYAPTIQANDGNFYGISEQGGAYSLGQAFKLTPDGQTLTDLHDFRNSDNGGTFPFAGLLQANDGNLYGVTSGGGGAKGDGTVFKLATDGQTFQALHVFGGGDGKSPQGALIQGSDGFLYGTTEYGGANNDGTVFMISTDGTTFRTLYSFTAGYDGLNPLAGLLQASDGNLYGVTFQGGANGDGTVFEIPLGGTALQPVYAFTDAASIPEGALLQGSDGNLYGVTQYDGTNFDGTVYKIALDGSGFQVLHVFDGGDGDYPYVGLLRASDGNLYGTASSGGADNDGTLFEVSTDGTTFQTLHDFTGAGDGSKPKASLIQGGDGNLYGTAFGGTVFRENVTLPDVVQFHTAVNSVSETAGTAMVRVDRIGDSGTNFLQVTCLPSDGTAMDGTDYTQHTGTLTWEAGDTSPKFFSVPIINRGLTDGSLRTLSIALSSVFDYDNGVTKLGYPKTATLTINDSIPGAPVIQSASTASGTTGQAFSYQIAASASRCATA